MADEQTDTQKFENLTKRMDAFEIEKVYETSLRALEKRIVDVEKVLWVLGALAIIFGAAGSWGFVAVRDAKKQVADLQNGARTVQDARNAALKAVDTEKVAQLLSFRAQANGIAHEAVTGEVKGQISAVKKWTAYIYSEATVGPSNSHWQDSLKASSQAVQQELKP
jgi:cell division protein FtsL